MSHMPWPERLDPHRHLPSTWSRARRKKWRAWAHQNKARAQKSWEAMAGILRNGTCERNFTDSLFPSLIYRYPS